MNHSEHKIILSVALSDGGQTGIALECQDPLIVRADAVVVDRGRHAISAVVDGIFAELGQLSDDLLRMLMGQQTMMVTARHFAGHDVRRRVPIINR